MNENLKGFPINWAVRCNLHNKHPRWHEFISVLNSIQNNYLSGTVHLGYYGMWDGKVNMALNIYTPTLVYTVDEFFSLWEKRNDEFIPGEWIEVRDDPQGSWKQRILMGYIKDSKTPFITVAQDHTDKYKQGVRPVSTLSWKEGRKIPKPVKPVEPAFVELTLQEIARKWNIPVDRLRIKD